MERTDRQEQISEVHQHCLSDSREAPRDPTQALGVLCREGRRGLNRIHKCSNAPPFKRKNLVPLLLRVARPSDLLMMRIKLK